MLQDILNKYPLDTFSGETKRELEEIITNTYNTVRKELVEEIVECLSKEEIINEFKISYMQGCGCDDDEECSKCLAVKSFLQQIINLLNKKI